MAHDFMSQFIKRATNAEVRKVAEEGRQWLTTAANKLDKIKDKVLADRPRDLSIGSMYLFIYDAKLKMTLKYYDLHPLIFPISVTRDRFMGLNFHYLPMGARIKLMDALYDFASKEKDERDISLNISYQLLKGIAKYRYFKPTVHLYLNNHVRSRFVWIPATQWKQMLFLPLQSFRGTHPNAVYTDSVNKY
jgi:hypothetical protein